MKKSILFLSMILLLFGVSGCGNTKQPAHMAEEEVVQSTAGTEEPEVLAEESETDEMTSESTELPTVKKITAEEAYERMNSGDTVMVVDVRRADEYEAGHIEGALLIPNEEIDGTEPAQLPDKDAEILIYCRSGNRSAQAANKLLEMGYTNLKDFGGITDWPYEVVEGAAE